MASVPLVSASDPAAGNHTVRPRQNSIPRLIHPLAQFLYKNHDYRFWSCQILGWAGYSLATFLSITLVDNNVSWPHIGHISLTALLGMFCTWLLRPLFRRTFNLSLRRKLLVAGVALVLLSGVWTVLRIIVFAWIVGEPAIWKEFHYWYYGSLFVFLSWTALYYGIRYYELLTLEHEKLLQETSSKRQEKIRRLQAESQARDAQLQMLRYQLNPHFLFNTLNCVSALVQLNENNRAREMIQLLSDFLRHSLEHDDIEHVTLEQELESLMLYLNIERARFEDRLKLEFDIEPAARRATVPGLILQPIVENSMKYAIADSENGGTVRVSAHLVRDQLLLEVSDTGPGMDTSKVAEGRGVGLRNTLERLETMYAGDYSFEAIDATPYGLTVRLCLPLQESRSSPINAAGQEMTAIG